MRALLVPVKSFRQAKFRLSGVLDERQRRQLARDLAEIVLGAGRAMAAFVACDDDEVADWAVSRGATVLWTPGRGLSGAVTTGVTYLGSHGFDLVVVAHADLPLVTSLADFGTVDEVALAPDHLLVGTNVASVPAAAGFSFAYGPGSFDRHREEAARLGLRCRVVYDPRLAADVDLPSDLALLPARIAPLSATRSATGDEPIAAAVSGATAPTAGTD